MLIIKLAVRNLLRHLPKTLVIGGLIAFGVGGLYFANAVFESSTKGMRASFVRSLTGDLALSARGQVAYGLFGSEVPIVSEYESIPAITAFPVLAEGFAGLDGLEAWTPLVSAAAQLRVGRRAIGLVPVFGVDPGSYFKVCSDLIIERGDPADLSKGGVFLSAPLAELIETRLNRKLRVREAFTFSMYSNGSVKVRSGWFAGVHAYPAGTEATDRLVLADPSIVRGLADYTLGFLGSEPALADGGDLDFDALFAEAQDELAADGAAIDLADIEGRLADTAERDLLMSEDAAAWSFALFRAQPGREAILERSLRSLVSERSWDARVLSWRQAAGTNAQALFAVQGAFYVGMGFIALGAVLVIMNSLVISVLERSAEIGTMRGLGAGAGFIRALFVAESMILTVGAALLGLMVGAALTAAASGAGLELTNPVLTSLFGGSTLRPAASLRSAFMHLGLAAAIGALSWIYPVSLALRIQPASSMGGA